MKTIVMGLAAAALAAGGIGCNNEVSCEDACEAKAECNGSPDLGDCEAECGRSQSAYEKAGCQEQFDEILECAEEDACGNGCDAVADKAGECVAAYCAEHLEECAPESRESGGETP